MVRREAVVGDGDDYGGDCSAQALHASDETSGTNRTRDRHAGTANSDS